MKIKIIKSLRRVMFAKIFCSFVVRGYICEELILLDTLEYPFYFSARLVESVVLIDTVNT